METMLETRKTRRYPYETIKLAIKAYRIASIEDAWRLYQEPHIACSDLMEAPYRSRELFWEVYLFYRDNTHHVIQ